MILFDNPKIKFVKLALLCLLSLATSNVISASSIQISASTQPGFRPSGLPATRTGTAGVVNGNANVTLATAIPTSWVGIGGYIVELGNTNYYVSTTNTASSLTLTTAYAGSTGNVTYRVFPFVLLRVYALSTFQPNGANYVVQQGAPGSGSWYKQVGVSVISDGANSTAYIPSITLDATTDAVNPATQNSRYFAGFYRIEGGLISPFLCFEQFRLPTATPTTWTDICTYNQTTTQPNDPTTYYTARQLDDRWRACAAGQSYYFAASGVRLSCLTYGNGLTLDMTTGTLSASVQVEPPTVQYLGSSLTQRSTINVGGITIDPDGDSSGLKAADNSTNTRTELRTQAVPTRWYNLITDGNGSPSEIATTGNISSGTTTLTVASAASWQAGQGIYVTGAGSAGAGLITTIVSISGTTFTLAGAASATVVGAVVRHDNTAAIQSLIDRKIHAFIPHGDYFIHGNITLPGTVTEGYPLVVQGAATGTAKLRFLGTGSLFTAQAGSSYQNIIFENLTFAGTVSNRGWAFDLSEAAVVNNLQIKNSQFNDWGRGAIVCSNCQNGVIEKNTIRTYNTAAIALVGPETVFVAGGENNVTAVKDTLIELGQYVADSDTALTGLSWTSGTKTITAGSALFDADMVGRFIRVTSAGQTGGDVIALIKAVNSSTSITVSAANNSGSTITGGTGTVYKTNIGSLWLHRASAGEFSNITIQGNWSNAVDGHVTSAVIVENSGNAVFKNLWVEDSGGNGGPDIKLTNTDGIQFLSYHSNADPGLWPASHSSLIQLTNAKNTYVSGLEDVSSISPFGMDTLSTLFVDNSYLGYAVNTGEAGYRNVTYGENVVFQLAGPTSLGTAFREDAVYGENFVLNPRYDAAAGASTSWTENIGAALTYTNAGTGRQQRYVTVNRQGASTSLSVSQTLTQTITIPDDVPAGPFVLGFDWRMEDHGTPRASTTGGQVYVDVTTSSTGGVGYPNGSAGFRWFNFTGDGTPEDTWLRQNFRLYLGTGTSRTFVIRIFSSAGASTPAMSFTNWRLQPGKHAAASYDQPITRYQGGIIETASTLTFTGVSNGCAQFTSGYLTSTGVACGSGGGGGGGLTSITAPTGGAQTGPGISFALGTSGTDASIAGSANTITFNFPTASASNRGLLAASDFSMFNSKIAGSIGNTQIGVGSGTSLSGSAALVYASNLVNNTVSFNGTVGFQSTNANAGTGANVEYGAYTGASSLRMVATGSGWSTPPGTLYGATSAILDAGTGTNVLLFSLNDSGGTKSMRWGIGQSEQMRLTETGLGIGTTSPSTKLHVYAASANTSGIRTERMTSATTPTGGAAVVGVDGSGNFVVAAASVVTDPGANGVMVRTAANTTTARTLTGTSNEITIADGTGVSGNPTFSLSSTFDISGKTSTKPMKVGTTAPATCDTGDFFFDSDAAAGSNVYACTDGAADTWTLQGGGGGGSTAWDALTNPASGNTSLSMGARTTTFTWGTATGSSVNMFSLADGAANTGTGYLLSVNTAASSAAQPFRFTAGGTSNGIEMSVLGVVQKKGTGGIDGSAIITSNSVANSVLDADLTALGDVASTGLWAVTSVGVSGAARTLTCTNCGTGTANLIIQNGNGVSGNPTFDTVQNIYTTATPQFARLGLGAAADATHILKLTGGTVTADTHLIDGVQTWNNAGVTFTAFKLNITNSASGGSSLLTDWQVGGASRFTVALSGAVTGGTYNGLTVSTTTGTLTLANSSSLITSGANSVTLVSTGTTVATLPAGTTTLASLTGAETLTNKTLTAPKFADLGFIADANGNELLIFDTVTSAVNEVTFANAATGANPTFTASGGDSNVGLDFQVKGTGVYRLLATASGPTDLRLFEDTDNGSNYASLLAPSSLASNVVATLPSVTGTLLTGTVGAAELAFGASGAITSSADFTYTTATGRLDISKSLNSSVPLVVTNASSGSAAQARVATSSDISGATIAAYSSTFTPSAGIVAGAAVLDLDGAAAILKGQSGGSMRLLLGSVEHLRLTSSGLAFYGSSSGSTVLTAAAAASGTLTLPATTGTLATLAGSESLTNKKLGSLTSNGLVTTSGGDGTLSVTVPGTNVLTALGVTLNNASGGLVTADGTATLTGKTIDASATGNAITLSSKIGFLGAGCNNTTAGAAWDLPTANAATATCRTPSSNTQRGLLDFTSAATNIAFNTFKLPADWVVGTGFDAEILWQTASTAGNVVWEISLACASPGDADDVAVSYQAFSASPANGTANRLISATKSNITTTGSCAAGDLVTVSVRRQGGTGSDTMTTNPARMAVLELTYWRTQ